ncbi:MAG: hypothetical protein IPK18_05835 [Sphingobacteriales bacterium]|jgi:competence protein ComGF|nr:MAG: hypothetical protein IPK18_05835 [Sphingobacteriales bacterium]
MKKLILLLISAMLFLSSCKKDNSLLGTRLKTFTFKSSLIEEKSTIQYNSFNKVDNVKVEKNGAHISTKYCIYKSDHSLDSIIIKNATGTITETINVECTNYKVTRYTSESFDIQINYNNNGTLNQLKSDKITLGFAYTSDTVSISKKEVGNPTISLIFYTIRKDIKNPFYITGFESEMYIVLGALLSNTHTPYTAFTSYAESKLFTSGNISFTYEGNFNGYPLKRFFDDGFTETFTYEEF